MTLACVELVCTTPISVFQIYLNATAHPLSPWRSWADTHYDFGRVDLLPEVIWRQNRTFHVAAEVSRWAPVFCAVVFFGFFGFANECRNNYRKLFRSTLVKCRVISEDDRQLSTKTSGAPKFVSGQSIILRVTNDTFFAGSESSLCHRFSLHRSHCPFMPLHRPVTRLQVLHLQQTPTKTVSFHWHQLAP